MAIHALPNIAEEAAAEVLHHPNKINHPSPIMDCHDYSGGRRKHLQRISLTLMPGTCMIRNLPRRRRTQNIRALDNAATETDTDQRSTRCRLFRTWVPLDERSGAAEVAGDVGVAVLLVEDVEGVGGVGEERVGLVARAAGLQLGAVGAAGATRPVERVLEVLLGGTRPRHAPRHAVDERHVAFRRRQRRDRRHRLCFLLRRDAAGCRG